MKFGEQLETYIREKDLSINGISKSTGINRGGLYNIFKGERNLSENKLSTIFQSIGASPEEERVLNELYFSEVFGELEFSKIKRTIENMSKTLLPEATYSIQAQSLQPSGPIFGKVNITRAVESILFNSENSEIITNYNYGDREIDEVFYAYVSSPESKSTVSHVLKLKKDSGSLDDIDTIFASIKYMHLGCFPLYTSETFSDGIFPYFVTDEKNAILFGESEAVFIDDSLLAARIFKKAKQIAKKASALGRKCEDLTQIMDFYSRGFTAHKEENNFLLEFCSYPCISMFADYDLISYVAAEALPNKEMFVNMAANYYKTMYENIKHTVFYTTGGLEKFAQTGIVSEIPQSMVGTLDREHKIEILKKMKDAIDSGRVYIIDESKFAFQKELEFSMYFGKLIISGYDSKSDRFFMGDRFISSINNYEIAHAFKLLGEYLIRSKQYHPKGYAKLFIDNLVGKLETEQL